MRLLNTHTLELNEFFEKEVPPYAILSHRWGDEEVGFAEMSLERSKGKSGFTKIQSFCRQALLGGFEYAWVDTCCINKDSSAELSEAINSMFRWYADAAVCYAYLADIDGHLPEQGLQEVLGKSKWFTRGWTLQELIAPRSVVFYSTEWVELGTRESLKPVLASITGIHTLALGGSIDTIITHFSIAQRMSWAANRTTTRVEDQAYCLLGIFNVNMPLLYGERDKAFIRLQEHIINETNDQTIFCWSDVTITTKRGKLSHIRYFNNHPTNLLAPSPLFFRNCATVAQVPDLDICDVFKMTKLGLSINGPVFSLRKRDIYAGIGDHLIYLRCYDQNAPNHHLAIMLRELGDDNFSRKNQTLCRLPGPLWEGTENRTIYIRKESAIPSYRKILQLGKSLAFRIDTSSLGGMLHVVECWPHDQWLPDENRLAAPAWRGADVSINNWSWHAVLLLRVITPAHAKLRGKKGYSVDCMLVLGYDGIHDRCWSVLKPGSKNLESMWEDSVDTSVQGATYKLPSSKINWTMKVDLVDFPEEDPIQIQSESSESLPPQSRFVVPVKIDISKSRLRTRKNAEKESFSTSNLRRAVHKLAGKQSFASLVKQIS